MQANLKIKPQLPYPSPQPDRAPGTFPAPRSAFGQGVLERLPKWLICVPLTVQWLWLALRYRSLTLPAAANPSITAGGLVGEGKLEYFRYMGPIARAATAPYCAVATHQLPSADDLLAMLARANLAFPIIAKPDLGLCGYGVKRLNSMRELLGYLAAFPRDETVVLQRYLPQEGEAGIFYTRDPVTQQARISGLALRYYARVTGDGVRTIAELVQANARTRRMAQSPRHSADYDGTRVPAAGEVVRLSTIGSTRVGGLYRDGAAFITPALLSAIDAIAQDMPLFHAGRFDVRFDSLHDLAAGTGFTIMEVNGAGSEAIQAWDPDTGLFDAFQMIFSKQRALFAIGDAMRRKGVRPVGCWALYRLNRRQLRLIDLYPNSN